MTEPVKPAGGVPFAIGRRLSLTMSTRDLTTASFLSDRQLPLVIRARSSSLDLCGWAAANRDYLRGELLKYGAVLFRGFPIETADRFQAFVRAVSQEPMRYRERSSPRSEVADKVYTSTDYPASERIQPHNEHSYASTFPTKLYFWCQQPAREGGQTPLGDMRRVFRRIDPAIAKRFLDRGWMYVRNFRPNMGLSWQTAFQTDDRATVEAYCEQAHITCEWTHDGLRTRQVRPVTVRHPDSGEDIWFNHAMFFHISSVEPGLRARLRAEYGDHELPNNTYYGDGTAIPDDVAQHLRDAYEQEMVSLDWERDDIVLIDNILTAHARSAFAGPRSILFAMAEPHTRPDLTLAAVEVRS